MVYSTPYVGNYVCIILVMLEEFILDGSFVGWCLITVGDSCTLLRLQRCWSWILETIIRCYRHRHSVTSGETLTGK